jgi:hypothetical protein
MFCLHQNLNFASNHSVSRPSIEIQTILFVNGSPVRRTKSFFLDLTSLIGIGVNFKKSESNDSVGQVVLNGGRHYIY